MNASESSEERQPVVLPEGVDRIEGTPLSSGSSEGLQHPRRRRRSSRRSGFGLLSFGKRDSKEGSRGRSRGRERSRGWNAERFFVVSCLILSAGVVGAVGFLAGKKSAATARLAEVVPKLEEVVPTAESETLVDSGFKEMGEGSFRRAFSVFQKAQESQPALSGIDYLVGYSALKAGEVALAKESLQHAVSKNEMDAEAKVLLALISLDESEKGKNGSEQMTDPMVTAESELRHYATTHPMSPAIYRQWGDMQRQHGSYRTAADLYHRAILRSDPDEQLSLLASREVLTRLQNQPAKELPSLASVTSMTGEEALGAALASLQNKSPSNAVIFLQRAKECFPQREFRELMNDAAFDEYKPDAKFSNFLETSFFQASKP